MRLLDLFEAVDIDKTLEMYSKKLESRFSEDRMASQQRPETFLDWIVNSIDPTNNDKYALWIIRTYVKGGIQSITDMGKVNHALKIFDKFKKKLPLRDINQIKTLNDLLNLVEPVEQEKTGKEKKREEFEKAKAESEVLYSGPDGKIIIPKTEYSSCFWGKGTRWCTASTEYENQFDAYNRQGPLYIIMPKDGTKWQLSLATGDFMDDQDVPANIVAFVKKYPWVKKIIGPLIGDDEAKINPKLILLSDNPSLNMISTAAYHNPELFEFMGDLSEAQQLAAVKYNGAVIRYLDDPSEDVQIAAIRNKGMALQWIKNPTEYVQAEAVHIAPYAILFVKDPSPKTQMLAIRKYPDAIQFIPNPTYDAMKLSIEGDPSNAEYIKNLPDDLQMEIANGSHPSAVGYINDPIPEAQKIAVQKEPTLIKHFKKPSLEAMKIAIEQKPTLIKFLKDAPEEIKKLAVRINPKVIHLIGNPTNELLQLAGMS